MERDGIIEEIEDEVLSRPFWTYAMRGFLWLSAIAVGLALLIAAALTVLDTDRGRVWLVARASFFLLDSFGRSHFGGGGRSHSLDSRCTYR